MYNTNEPRTNSHLEGWHNQLKRVVGTHPNIFECVEIFQREQMATELLLMQLSTGAKANLKSQNKGVEGKIFK